MKTRIYNAILDDGTIGERVSFYDDKGNYLTSSPVLSYIDTGGDEVKFYQVPNIYHNLEWDCSKRIEDAIRMLKDGYVDYIDILGAMYKYIDKYPSFVEKERETAMNTDFVFKYGIEFHDFTTLELYKHCKSGDFVLIEPCCANMYGDFEEAFFKTEDEARAIVKKLWIVNATLPAYGLGRCGGFFNYLVARESKYTITQYLAGREGE